MALGPDLAKASTGDEDGHPFRQSSTSTCRSRKRGNGCPRASDGCAFDRGDAMNRIRLATTGLLVAWMVHDLEELATMSDNSRALMSRVPDWIPVPASVRQRGLTARHEAIAIAGVGLVITAAALGGDRTRGHSAF
jgi:hypothetical protein